VAETVKITDPQGYEITLSAETWHKHIVRGHVEVGELLDVVLKTLEEPEVIQKDPDFPEVHTYYRLTGRSIFRRNDIYMGVVVENIWVWS
jgi:capsid portal protein